MAYGHRHRAPYTVGQHPLSNGRFVANSKRLACACFMWDTQNAVLFSHTMSMSASEIQTTLPCHWTAWEASSAQEWWRYITKEPPVSFQAVLRAYLEPELGEIPTDLNAFSYLLVLNGLLSVQYEMKQFDRVTC